MVFGRIFLNDTGNGLIKCSFTPVRFDQKNIAAPVRAERLLRNESFGSAKLGIFLASVFSAVAGLGMLL